jgi:hypothetical protein
MDSKPSKSLYMKVIPVPKAQTFITSVLLMVMGGTALGAVAPPPALEPKLVLRSLTPQDIKDYSLTNAQIASGLSTVGVGQPVHLEAWVNSAIPVSSVTGVTWALKEKPAGSTAVLRESPLGANVPIFEPSDRLVSRVVGRSYLLPDLLGQYTIEATITTTTGTTNLTKKITSGRYMGVNTCALCHSGGQIAPSMVAGWSETAHATKFARGIDGHEGAKYSKNCISCHTVGFDTNTNAVNGGFDDLAAQLGWTFPTVVTNGNWEAVPAALKNLANIQCENCHGAGSEHAYSLGDVSKISISMSAGNCGQCHDSKNAHFRNAEWYNSKHAITTRYPTGASRAACVGCHSGVGFIDRMDGLTAHRTDYEAITCATCHDPHDAKNPHQLRNTGPVKLSDGVTEVTKGGNGLLCMNCHKARVNGKTYAETTAGSSNFSPHYGSASDMLAGANGYTYGKIIPSSAHREVVPDSCVTCHMQPVAATNAVFTKVGNHTFNPSWDGGTPDNHADDVQLTSACVQCHGPTSTFDFQRQDFDGDGVTEGVQTEVHGLLDELAMLLPPIGSTEVLTSTNYTRAQLKAAYNYKFVKYDGSYGVHNLSYAVGLLKASIADLTDDADHDGLSDKWEIASFGSILHCNPLDDFDGDGVNAALEFAAGTNPKLRDSDGDGISDMAELEAGSDPVNAQDTPGFVLKIHNAGEVEFASEPGKTYQIQVVSELNSSWQTVSTNIPGTGDVISHLVSLRNGGGKAFYRVITITP